MNKLNNKAKSKLKATEMNFVRQVFNKAQSYKIQNTIVIKPKSNSISVEEKNP